MNFKIKVNFFIPIYVLLLAMWLPTCLWAQNTPGGVPLDNIKMELWLSADKLDGQTTVLPAEGTAISSWVDRNGVYNFVNNGTNARPVLRKGGQNYNAALEFKGSTNVKLISQNNFSYNTANQSYYVFYVSKVDAAAIGTTRATVFSFGSGRSEYDGWYKSGSSAVLGPWSTTRTYTNVIQNTALNKNHGIATSIRPNFGSGARYLYHNGQMSTVTSGTNTMATSGNYKAVIGNSTDGTSYPFYGEIQEIIVLSAPQNTNINPNVLQRIHSYLAIKYGETLDGRRYINADGAVLWGSDASHQAAAYGNRIIGIGRDDVLGINQKQARSADKSFISVFMGNTLQILNSENTYQWPTDKVFYMFGSNNLDGYDEYIQAPETTFQNGVTLPSQLNIRQKEIHTVKLTNASSATVNIKSHYQHAQYALVSADNSFNPATTRAYLLDGNDVARNVVLNDNDFISFAAFLPSPGGGDGLELALWLAADQLSGEIPDEGQDVKQWTDVHGKLSFVPQGTTKTPVFTQFSNNYQAAVSFPYREINTDRVTKLISDRNFSVDRGYAYYTFWVSRPEESDMALGTVFQMGGGTNVGWGTAAEGLWTTTGGTGSGRTLTSAVGLTTGGIGTVIRDNTGSTANSPVTLMFNGKVVDTKPAGQTEQNTNILASIGTSVSTPTGVTNYFYGDVQEIIVYRSDKNAIVPVADLQKIQTYLALKYSYSLAEGNYISSSGKIVWNRAESNYNEYSTEIFGIGRDHNSSLYQKQSGNPGKKALSLFVGEKLEEANVDNTGTIADENFFLLGANNLVGSQAYSYDEGQVFGGNGTVLHKDINKIERKIYKAKITGNINVNLYVHASVADVVLVSTDPTFPVATTKAYNIGEEYGQFVKNIDIQNGEYVTFAYKTTGPGGVADNLRLWLRGGQGVETTSGTNEVSEWMDQSEFGNNYSYSKLTTTDKRRPKLIVNDNRMNFNPTINFEEQFSGLAIAQGPMSVDAPEDFTSFVVYNQTRTPLDQIRLYTHGFGGTNSASSSSRSPAMGFSPRENGGRIRNGSTNIDGGNGNTSGINAEGFQMGATALSMIHTHKGTTGGPARITFDFGGWVDPATPSGANTLGNFKLSKGGTIGGASFGTGQFQGIISEIIYYERALDPEEKEQVQAYLAVKYGITLDVARSDKTRNYDYLFSIGKGNMPDPNRMMWPGNFAPYNKFHTNVAGLINDEASASFNNKAKSSGPGAIMTMSVKGHNEEGQGDYGLLPNLSSIFWGHDQNLGETNFAGNDAICGEMDARINRVWLINKTAIRNDLGQQAVTIRIANSPDIDGIPGSGFHYAGKEYQLYMLVADSYEDIQVNGPNTGLNWKQMIPGTHVNGEQEFNYLVTNKNTYVSFGYKLVPGAGCEECEIQGVKKIAFTSKTWNRKGGPTQTLAADGEFSATIGVTTDLGLNLYRWYPRASSGKSLQMYRRSASPNAVMTTTIVASSAATASFELFEIDYRMLSYDEVEIYGLCEDITENPGAVNTGTKTLPRLSYKWDEKRSSYKIQGFKANAIKRGSGYNNNRGKLQVDFDYPVKSIVIKHKASSRRANVRQRIGLGPIDFLCIPPLPEQNEDGLIFTKQGPTDVQLCETVEYTFRIVNTNCAPTTGVFKDILPEGMIWVPESVSMPAEGLPSGEDLNTNEYGGTKTLDINNLVIPGGQTLTFRASARFAESATAGIYQNQAAISYKSILNPAVTHTLQSCDRLNPTCSPTATQATGQNDRQEYIVVEAAAAPACYKEDNEVEVTVSVRNPNNLAYSATGISFNFNEEFALVPNSLVVPSALGVGQIEIEAGMISIENLRLPANTGGTTYEIKFKVVAPTKNGLIEELDENGTPIPLPGGQGNEIIPLAIEYTMFTEADDICSEAAFDNATGDLIVPYCLSKRAVISNKNVRSHAKK